VQFFRKKVQNHQSDILLNNEHYWLPPFSKQPESFSCSFDHGGSQEHIYQ